MADMSFDFRKLDVYKRTLEFISKANCFCKTSPKLPFFLQNQLKRAALSILTNLAEGSGRWHSKDKRYFYLISRGSVYECVAIIDSCRKVRQGAGEETSGLLEDLLDITKMLTKLIQRFSN